MSDIFVSYASEDRNRILPLVNGLEKTGWSIFWDRVIPAGRAWRQVIGDEVRACRSVVVVWTEKSVTSEWVLEEAETGKRRLILVPILLDNVEPPFGFGTIQAANLVAWNGDHSSTTFTRLVADIATILGPSPAAVKEAEERRRLEAEAQRKAEEERLREEERQQSAEEARRKAEEENRRRIEEEENRARQEAEAQRKAEEERLREEERQRSAEEARRKAEEENRRRIEEEENRARQEAEAQRKAEEERLREEERQRSAEEARRKAEEENRRRIEEEENRARQEAEAQRKAEEERLREEERQQSAEEARRKAEEENRRRIEEEENRARQEAEAQRKAEEERLREEERQRSAEKARRKAEEKNRRRIEQAANRARLLKEKRIASEVEQARKESPAAPQHAEKRQEVSVPERFTRSDRRRLYASGAVVIVGVAVMAFWFFGPSGSKDADVKKIVSVGIQGKRQLNVGEKIVLRVGGRFSDGRETDVTKNLDWASSDDSVVAVSRNGQVEARKEGFADITVRYEGVASPPLTLMVRGETRPAEADVAQVATKIQEHIKTAGSYRDRGEYSIAFAELAKAKSLDPANKVIQGELESTKKACLAEQRIVLTNLRCE